MSVALRWLSRWRECSDDVSSPEDFRRLHRWLWRTWRCLGKAAASEINTTLDLIGPDLLQPDVPHAFAGNPFAARLLYVNINPGWNEARNRIEESIVGRSENETWDFSRQLFTRYPAKVGRMYWWNRSIGVAWRIEHGGPPLGIAAREKRAWANEHIGAVELLPLHSNSAGFLHANGPPGTPKQAMRAAIEQGMRATLRAALRLRATVSIVCSHAGAAFVNEQAQLDDWTSLPVPAGLPGGTTAHRVDGVTVVAIPRPLVTKRSALAPDVVAASVRQILEHCPT